MNRTTKAKRVLIFAIKSGIAAVLLYLLLRTTRYEEFADNFRRISWWWFLAATSLHIVGYLVSAHRWRILLVAQGVQISLWKLIKSYIIATFFNYVLLGTLGGDISRAYDTGLRSRKGAQAVSAVFVERLTGLVAMMFLAAVGILFLLVGPGGISVSAFWNVQAAIATCAAMFILLFATIFVLFHPRIVKKIAAKLDRPPPFASFFKRRNHRFGLSGAGWVERHGATPRPNALLEKEPKIVKKIAAKLDRPAPFFGRVRKIFLSFHSAITVYRADLTPIYKNLFWALVLQLNVTLHYFFIGLAMGLPLLNFFSYMVIVPAITLILMIPITPGGAGVREWTLRELRTGIGFSGARSAIAGSTLLGWLQVASVLLYGVIGFLMFGYRLFSTKRSKHMDSQIGAV